MYMITGSKIVRKAINFLEVEVNVPKWTLRFREKITIDVLVSSNPHSSIFVMW